MGISGGGSRNQDGRNDEGRVKDSIERRSIDQENVVICAGGYVLRKREWAERGEECLGEACPHPVTCTTKHRDFMKGEPCGK